VRTKPLPCPELTQAILNRFLPLYKLDRIDVSAYDLAADPHTTVGRKTSARSVCVVVHYPAHTNQYVPHVVVSRYHLKPGTDLSKPSTIRGILTRINNQLNPTYRIESTTP